MNFMACWAPQDMPRLRWKRTRKSKAGEEAAYGRRRSIKEIRDRTGYRAIHFQPGI